MSLPMLNVKSLWHSPAHGLLWLTTLALFLGKTIQACFLNTTLSEFAGVERLMHPLVSPFTTWHTYGSHYYPVIAETTNTVMASIWFMTFIALFFKTRFRPIVWIGALLLTLDTLLPLFVGFSQFASVFAKTLVWSTPFFFLRYQDTSITRAMKWAIALVFTFHGLMALNVIPRPGNYEDMFVQWSGFNSGVINVILIIVGILDLIVSLFLLIQKRPLPFVWFWTIGWGFLTALARLDGIQHYYFTEIVPIVIIFSDVLIRLPHALVPLALMLLMYNRFYQSPKISAI